MKRLLLGGLGVLVAAVTALAALPVAANHAWGPYHWERSSNPISITLGDNVSGPWDTWLAEAADDWGASTVLDASVSAGQAKGNCRPTDGRVEVCNDAYGPTGWLGIAQIWVSGDHIVRAVAKMNDTYHNVAPYDSDGWRDLVMCQEVGHTFGLGHQDEAFDNGNLGTCMDYTSNPDGPPANRAPDAHDYAMLEEIYAHLDASGGGGGDEGPAGGCKGGPKKCGARGAAPPVFNGDFGEPGAWGKLVSLSRDGGQAVFENDLGRGYKVVTHVTWTLDVAKGLSRH